MFLSFLTIVSVRAMLTVVVLLYEERIHRSLGVERECDVSHLGALLHHLGVVYRIGRTCTP